jgi:hypothetical protein
MKKFMWVVVMLAVTLGLFVLASPSANGPEPEPVPTQTESFNPNEFIDPGAAWDNLVDENVNEAAKCDQALDRALTGVDDPELAALAIALWQQCRAEAG